MFSKNDALKLLEQEMSILRKRNQNQNYNFYDEIIDEYEFDQMDFYGCYCIQFLLTPDEMERGAMNQFLFLENLNEYLKVECCLGLMGVGVFIEFG